MNDLANLIDFVGFLNLILLNGLMKIISSINVPKKPDMFVKRRSWLSLESTFESVEKLQSTVKGSQPFV